MLCITFKDWMLFDLKAQAILRKSRCPRVLRHYWSNKAATDPAHSFEKRQFVDHSHWFSPTETDKLGSIHDHETWGALPKRWASPKNVQDQRASDKYVTVFGFLPCASQSEIQMTGSHLRIMQRYSLQNSEIQFSWIRYVDLSWSSRQRLILRMLHVGYSWLRIYGGNTRFTWRTHNG